ncbi:hypothetical protein OAX78_04125, partial [Planctomycetota bacterium]|nr:hypothetical protein [Planctomycetota bacterium]
MNFRFANSLFTLGTLLALGLAFAGCKKGSNSFVGGGAAGGGQFTGGGGGSSAPAGPVGSVAFALATSATLDESTAASTVNVQLTTGGPALASAVTVEVVDAASGTATSGADYGAFALATVTFPAGSASGALQAVTINVTDDGTLEPNETVDLQLQNPGGTTLGGQTTHTLTITDDDTPTIAFQAATSATADESAATFNVVVELTAPAPLAAPFSVEVMDNAAGTGTITTDYTFTPNPITVTFPMGATNGATMNVGIGVLADGVLEPNETVILDLQNPMGGNVGAITQHTATIMDDDVFAQFTAAAQGTANEGAAALMATVTLVTTNPLLGAVSVDVMDNGAGTATIGAGMDYTFTPNPTTLTFPLGSMNGATMNATVNVLADALVEADETVILDLQNPMGLTIGMANQHTITITDDDFEVRFMAATSSVPNENATAVNVVVELVAGAGKTLPAIATVQVNDGGAGTATSGAGMDYTTPVNPQTVTFVAGSVNGATQNAVINVLADALVEGNETVILDLQTPVNVALGATTQHTFTITDDDQPSIEFQAA